MDGHDMRTHLKQPSLDAVEFGARPVPIKIHLQLCAAQSRLSR